MEDQSKMAVIEDAHEEEQAQASRKIEQLQRQNASLQNEKAVVARRLEGLESRMQQGQFGSKFVSRIE